MEKKKVLKVAKFTLRWGIAVLGIWYVVSRMSWHDRVSVIFHPGDMPQSVVVARQDLSDENTQFPVIDPKTGTVVTLSRDDVVNDPDRAKLSIWIDKGRQYVIGVDLAPDLKSARRLLLADTPTGPNPHWVRADAYPQYHLTVPHPRVQMGVVRMIREANSAYLMVALAIIPLTILITSFRWNELLKALDIKLSLTRTFVLCMVGGFYNTFMPGSTGGDLLKAYYIAKQTHHRTRGVMSVIVDRVIGLLALVILGGVMAALQSHIPVCKHVAMASAAIIACAAVGIALFYNPTLRKYSGMQFILNRLPMQRQVNHAIETMHLLGRRPLLVLGALMISFPVHMVIILAAMFCGMAFGLPISPFYYWMVVPVVVLAGAIPISPQGAGVMEYFAIKLLGPEGATVGQAFALTMSIRLVQIFWNLTGGFFVLRGGYHAPTATEQKEVEAEDEDEKGTDAGTRGNPSIPASAPSAI